MLADPMTLTFDQKSKTEGNHGTKITVKLTCYTYWRQTTKHRPVFYSNASTEH